MSWTTLRRSLSAYRSPTRSSTSTGSEYNESDYNDEKIRELAFTYEEIQKKTFTKWINSQLIDEEDQIVSIDLDLRDGKLLLKLLETLSKQALPKPEKLSMRIHYMSNVTKALHFLEKNLGESLSNIGSEDIVDGNTKLTLGLIWLLILKFQIQQVDKEELVNSLEMSFSELPGDNEKKSRSGTLSLPATLSKKSSWSDLVSKKDIKGSLLLWVQNQLSIFGELAPIIKDFHRSWKNGAAFSALINRHDPRLIAHPEVVQTRVERGKEEWKNILNDAFLVANEEMGIPFLLEAEDIVNVDLPDEKSIMTYVSEYYKVMSKKQKDAEYCEMVESSRKELDLERNRKKLEELATETIAVSGELLKEIQTSLNSLPIISDVEIELDQLSLGNYWASLASFESTASKLSDKVQSFQSDAQSMIADDNLLAGASKDLLQDKLSEVSSKHEHLSHEASNRSRLCKELQTIVDKREEIGVFEKAIEELKSDVHKLIDLRLSGGTRKDRSSLLVSINHDIEELEHSAIMISNEMPNPSPKYLVDAKEALLNSISDTKVLVEEENDRFKQEKSAEDFQARYADLTSKFTEGIEKITGIEEAILACVCDFGKYKTVLSEQKSLLKNSSNSLKARESELLSLAPAASTTEENTEPEDSNSKAAVSHLLSVAQGLAQQWHEKLEKLVDETQKFDELFKYLQIEKLIRTKLVSIKSSIDSWDEESAEHIMIQTGNGLRLLRKKFDDMSLLYSKAAGIQLTQERHAELKSFLEENEKLYEEKWQELSQKRTPTRWQDTAKDIESVLENLRSTLSSRIPIHGLSCTSEQHDSLLEEIDRFDKEIIDFEKTTWEPFEAQTTERLGESSPGIRGIIENIHQVLLGSWIEVQESLERRKREVRLISRGFEFAKCANELEVKMRDRNLLATKIADEEVFKSETEAQLDWFKSEIDDLSLKYEELFDSEDEIYVKRLTELENIYESTRGSLIESQKESNSKAWWEQAETVKARIAEFKQETQLVPSKIEEFKSKSDVDSHLQSISQNILNLEEFEKNELALLTRAKDCLDSLPDEEKPQDLDKIASDYETIQTDISDLKRSMNSSLELLNTLLDVLPLQIDLTTLSEQLALKNTEVKELRSNAKWNSEIGDITQLLPRYNALEEQLTQIKEKQLLPHSQSVAPAVDLLQNSLHPGLVQMKKEILKKRDLVLAQYDNIGSSMENTGLIIRQTSGIVKFMTSATELEASISEVRDLFDKHSTNFEEDDSIIGEKLKVLQENLEELNNQVHTIPGMDNFLDGNAVSESSSKALQAATSRYQNLAESIQSVHADFSKQKYNLQQNAIHDDFMQTYIQLQTWIKDKEAELRTMSTSDITGVDISILEAQWDNVTLIVEEIPIQESSYLSLNTLRLKFEESAQEPNASSQLQYIANCSKEIDESWSNLKQLVSGSFDNMKSTLASARYLQTAQNILSTLNGIQQEIESTDAARVENDIVLKWREQLETIEQDSLKDFHTVSECYVSEHKSMVRKQHENIEDILDQAKAQLAKFVSSIKSSRLLAVYLDDVEDFRSTLVERNREISTIQSTHSNMSGESLEKDESQLNSYILAYTKLESDLRMCTARHDHLREYYFTILAQSPDATDKISQSQDQIESEWARLSGVYHTMKKEIDSLRMYVQWHQQLRDAENLLNPLVSRAQSLVDIDSMDLEHEVDHLEKGLIKCRGILNFTDHPDWLSPAKNQEDNMAILKKFYSSLQIKLEELELAPYNLKELFVKNSLDSIQQQLAILQDKTDSIRNCNEISLDLGRELKEIEATLRHAIMSKIQKLDELFISSESLNEKYQSQRSDAETRAKSLHSTLDELKNWVERVQEFHLLVDRIDNALGSLLDLVDQNPGEGGATAYSIIKQLESSFASLSRRVPKAIEKAKSLAEGLNDWDVAERLKILPEQWEEMKSLVMKRLQQLNELAKRKISRSGLIPTPTERRSLSPSRSISPYTASRSRSATPQSIWRPTSPMSGSYMRPTMASLSRVSAGNQPLKSSRKSSGRSPSSSPLPKPTQTKKKVQARVNTWHTSRPVPKRLVPTSPNNYIPDPKDPLDVEVARIVNCCPLRITITKANESGRYWIGEVDPKLCYCRILNSKMVMVRVGGGWAELSRYLSDHSSFERKFIPVGFESESIQNEDLTTATDNGVSGTPQRQVSFGKEAGAIPPITMAPVMQK
ncbi:hypothetical protein K7432_001617 [Basidiobolus ranarum]|uniref:Uncharacterized protein n=1 Tax=Basidiobolus ranarum TaxID=34480 RepID=A0ABR2W973_9FUNG